MDSDQEQQIQQLEEELQQKQRDMNKFRQEMHERRIKMDIEEDNPFIVKNNTAYIDKQLAELQKEPVIEGHAGVVTEERIQEILKKVLSSKKIEEKDGYAKQQ